MMNVMCGIERWSGLSALGFLLITFPGALPQAGIGGAFGPPTRRQRRNPSQRGSKALDSVTEIEAEQTLNRPHLAPQSGGAARGTAVFDGMDFCLMLHPPP